VIVDGKIQQIAGQNELDKTRLLADLSLRIDGKDLHVIPGLIDLHTHLLLHPYNQAKWDDQVLKESLELRTIRGVMAARATLEAGFTTIRDLGTEGAAYADVGLRDAITQHIIPGPTVVTTTRAIVATGCYGPAGFDPRWDVPQGAQEVTGIDQMRKTVREQIAAGADWIKVYADYHRSPHDPTTPTFSEDEIRAAVDEARSAGRHVAAHATSDDGIRRAVLAGVTTIEHGYGATRATLELMKNHGVVLCPTMSAAEAVAIYAGWTPDAKTVPPSLAESRASFALAREVGVIIANGSDAGVFAHGQNARELELMVAGGMSPREALTAATITAARVLDREKDLGRVDVGFTADLVLVRGDPLADVVALRKPAVVIKHGEVVADRR